MGGTSTGVVSEQEDYATSVWLDQNVVQPLDTHLFNKADMPKSDKYYQPGQFTGVCYSSPCEDPGSSDSKNAAMALNTLQNLPVEEKDALQKTVAHYMTAVRRDAIHASWEQNAKHSTEIETLKENAASFKTRAYLTAFALAAVMFGVGRCSKADAPVANKQAPVTQIVQPR